MNEADPSSLDLTVPDPTPCPFCGSRDLAVEWWEWGRDDMPERCFAVVCQSCKAMGPEADTPDGARDAWRRRFHATGEDRR